MLQKILFLSISIISLIAVDNLEPDWRKDPIMSIVQKIDRDLSYAQNHGNNWDPVSLEKDNFYYLLNFFYECQKIEEAKDTKNQAKIEKAIVAFKQNTNSILTMYKCFSGNLAKTLPSGEIDMNHLPFGQMEIALNLYSSHKEYKVTLNTVIKEVAKPNLAVLKNMYDHKEDNTYDAYILSPIAKKYKPHPSSINDMNGIKYQVQFIVLQDKE